jgi:hypothetical protein
MARNHCPRCAGIGAHDPPEYAQIVRMMNRHGYELCAQNVIILDKINEYFLIDRS